MGSASTRGAAAFVALLFVIAGTSSVVDACSNSITGLSPCSDAVEPGGGSPSTECCDTVTSWGLPCLCSVLSKFGSSPPPDVDVNRVLALPGECGINASGYQCDGYTIP